ncbi:AraC family transcriptional regulator [Paenibacillus sp. Marseille-Q4541]|uniref:helix-turn-helix domain-containing protein n=1 Tax=Paenibacillus sp. Marseille-Q4541 TaxID=2831522 RepID=UPI001BAA1EDE|nr:AraC family transcriptional regulator [Paenibacillus sp. Marseille-Q4541]
MKTIQDFHTINKLIHDAYHVPIFLITPDEAIQEKLSYGEVPSPVHPHAAEMLATLIATQDEEIQQMPVIKTTSLGEYYVVLYLVDDEACYVGKLIAGPFLLESYSEEVIVSLMYDVSAPRYQLETWKQYFKQMAILNRKTMKHLGELMYYLVHNKRLDGEAMLKQQVSPILEQDEEDEIEKEIEQELSQRRDHETYHHELAQEESLFASIRQGSVSRLIAQLSSLDLSNNAVLSKKSHLRSQKNLAISGITLATRAAMKGGLLPELAYTLSDIYIQRVEELQNVKDVFQLQKETIIEFARRVQNSKTEQFSKEVAQCTYYIFNHLLEDLSLERLARHVNLTPSYLSTRFKKETGLSIVDYIQRERVYEAQKMLKFSSISLSDICARLNFNDQSYFTRVFKKWSGVTPLQYRKKGEPS